MYVIERAVVEAWVRAVVCLSTLSFFALFLSSNMGSV